MREQATRTERRSRKGIACAAVLACVLGAGCLAWGCTPAAAPSDGADKTADSTTTTEPAPATSDGYSDQLASISGFPTEGRFVDGVTALPGFYQNSEKNAANAEANEPLRYTDRNGFTVQPVPSDDRAFNITYLNAENRGCTSCHTLESAIMSLPTYHRLIFFGYPTEQTFANCIACHSKTYQGTNYLGEAIHNTHMTNAMFTSQGGTCFSCHYNDVETQTLGRWDDYKYNLYHGITDVAAEEVQVTTSYDQTTITPAENRFFKTVKDEPSEWLVDDTQVDPSIYENWAVSIDGDCDNPVTMTLPEMEEQFGTVKQVMKMDCTINGVGQATIMQSEVEGIPLSKVIEFAKPKASANIVSPIGCGWLRLRPDAHRLGGGQQCHPRHEDGRRSAAEHPGLPLHGVGVQHLRRQFREAHQQPHVHDPARRRRHEPGVPGRVRRRLHGRGVLQAQQRRAELPHQCGAHG